MRLHVYRGDQLAAVFEYGQEPTYHGGAGAEVKQVVEAGRAGVAVPAAGVSGVPSEWLQWIASIVFPALSSGAFVRWHA